MDDIFLGLAKTRPTRSRFVLPPRYRSDREQRSDKDSPRIFHESDLALILSGQIWLENSPITLW